MANFEIPQDPNFTTELRKLEPSDPGHADIFNDATKKLFYNALFLKKISEEILKSISNVDNTSDIDKPVSTAARTAIDESYISSNGYADTKIAALVNGAPEALDTLLELADALSNNQALADALSEAIGKKANQTELDTHTGNNTTHVTASKTQKWDGYDAKITKNTNDITTVNSNLGGLNFYEDAAGKYVVGADSVPKKLGSTIIDCGIINGQCFYELIASGTKDIKPFYSEYQKLKNTNFVLQITRLGVKGWHDVSGQWTRDISPSLSYNVNNGILTVSGLACRINDQTTYAGADCSVKIILIV